MATLGFLVLRRQVCKELLYTCSIKAAIQLVFYFLNVFYVCFYLAWKKCSFTLYGAKETAQANSGAALSLLFNSTFLSMFCHAHPGIALLEFFLVPLFREGTIGFFFYFIYYFLIVPNWYSEI